MHPFPYLGCAKSERQVRITAQRAGKGLTNRARWIVGRADDALACRITRDDAQAVLLEGREALVSAKCIEE